MRKRIVSFVLLMAVSGSAFALAETKDVKAAALTTVSSSVTATKAKATQGNPVLRRGSKGSDVEQLQMLLNCEARNYKHSRWSVGKVDGSFGPKTEKALKAFQKDNHLKVDGVCGPKTWRRLWDLVV